MPSFFKDNLSSIKYISEWERHTLFVRIVSVRTYKTLDTYGEAEEIALVTIDDPFSIQDAYISAENFLSIKTAIAMNQLLLVAAFLPAPNTTNQAIEILDAYKIERPLPDIKPEDFHFYYVRYMAEREIIESTISATIKNINQQPDKQLKPFNITNIPLDDPATYTYLQNDDDNAFELLSPHSNACMKAFKPTTIEELAATVRLSSSLLNERGITEAYLECVQGKNKPSYFIPEVKSMLESTHGFIIYQEQIRQIVEQLAGFSPDESKAFYKALARKRQSDLIEMRTRLTDAVCNCMTKDEAHSLFDWLEKHAGSAIKKSTWIEPLTICYQLAWLKVHYHHEFECALALV